MKDCRHDIKSDGCKKPSLTSAFLLIDYTRTFCISKINIHYMWYKYLLCLFLKENSIFL